MIAVACKSDGPAWQLELRQLGTHGQERTSTISIPASIAGTPAVSGTAIVVPLADGSLARAPLTGESRRDIGPNSRAPRRIARCAMPCPGLAKRRILGLGRQSPAVAAALARRHTVRTRNGPSVRTWREVNWSAIRLPEENLAIVADTSGTVSLIRGPSPRVKHTWRVGTAAEPITSGPWVVGERAYVIVNHHKLVALDPMNDKPAWIYESPGDGIVFAPALIDGRLIVADQAGTYVALDAATGTALGPGFHHPAVVAPASAPVAFGIGRIFAPLTDGSALVLKVADLIAPQ